MAVLSPDAFLVSVPVFFALNSCDSLEETFKRGFWFSSILIWAQLLWRLSVCHYIFNISAFLDLCGIPNAPYYECQATICDWALRIEWLILQLKGFSISKTFPCSVKMEFNLFVLILPEVPQVCLNFDLVSKPFLNDCESSEMLDWLFQPFRFSWGQSRISSPLHRVLLPKGLIFLRRFLVELWDCITNLVLITQNVIFIDLKQIVFFCFYMLWFADNNKQDSMHCQL